MKEESKKLKKYIEGAENILVTTHRGPDPDANSSLLLVFHTLREFFNKKNITAITQEKSKYGVENIGWGELYNEIINITEKDTVDLSDYDLIVITDVNELNRCFDNYEGINDNTIVVSIDHHQTKDEIVNKLSLSINHYLSSAAEQVYTTFKDIIGKDYTKDKYISTLTQIGIIGDTNRFMYEVTKPSTFRVMAELVETVRVDVEALMVAFASSPLNSYKSLKEVLENLHIHEDMCYTYLTKEFIIENNLTDLERNSGASMFMQNILRNLEGINWGFIIKESIDTPNKYSISFRARNNTKNVQTIAQDLNGGGHISAAGATVEANNMDDAIQKVLTSIK